MHTFPAHSSLCTRRLDHVQPYSSLAVRKLTRTLAIGEHDGGLMQAGKSLLGGCTGNWLEDWDKFERTVNLDHVLPWHLTSSHIARSEP